MPFANLLIAGVFGGWGPTETRQGGGRVAAKKKAIRQIRWGGGLCERYRRNLAGLQRFLEAGRGAVHFFFL